MMIEEYLDFLAADDIRVKGTRVGIESILYEYIYRQRSPEEILKHFSTLSLAQIYATILYYLTNKEAVDQYLADWLEWSHQQRKAQELNPHPASIRLQKIKMERQKNGTKVSH
ncbi:DUF433 domain-containing protein [Microcoleus sp. ARI1-B5]|uniref:DUF433 domain-containing protein n=1 Tax=unclassified Microcoleus TaxID=2642155 RepID=UPI002FD403BB